MNTSILPAMQPAVLAKLFGGIDLDHATALVAKLTPREKDVAELMAMGHTNNDIAERLGISPKTLDIHRKKIVTKLETPAVGIGRVWFAAKAAKAIADK